jgi:glycosyltransferase involved in cell wall biosynthesis
VNQERLDVLFVIPGAAEGNSMIFARRQAEALVQTGVAVTCFHLRSRTSPRILYQEFRRLRGLVARTRPRVIHAHFGTMTGLFTVLAAGRIPVVITYRGSDLNSLPSDRSLRARLGRIFSQLAALRAARIVCVSAALRNRLWWRRERAEVLPSGVDLEAFCPLPREAARAALDWPPGGRVVLFNAGRDPANKRLDLAEAACDRARRELGDLRLEVLHGDVPPQRMPLLLNAADCLLLTSDAEGSPTVVQEALACDLPVVSVEVGDVAEVLEGVPGARIAPRDAAELARALVEIVAEPLRSGGRARAVRFSHSHIAGRLTGLYRSAASAGGR